MATFIAKNVSCILSKDIGVAGGYVGTVDLIADGEYDEWYEERHPDGIGYKELMSGECVFEETISAYDSERGQILSDVKIVTLPSNIKWEVVDGTWEDAHEDWNRYYNGDRLNEE